MHVNINGHVCDIPQEFYILLDRKGNVAAIAPDEESAELLKLEFNYTYADEDPCACCAKPVAELRRCPECGRRVCKECNGVEGCTDCVEARDEKVERALQERDWAKERGV
jgi:hypothetical protein